MAGILKALGRKSSDDVKAKVSLPALIASLRADPSPSNLEKLCEGVDVLLSPPSPSPSELETLQNLLLERPTAAAGSPAGEPGPSKGDGEEERSPLEMCVGGMPQLEFEKKKSTCATLLNVLSPPPPLPTSFYTLLTTIQNSNAPSCLPLGNLLRHTLSHPPNASTYLESPTFLTVSIMELPLSPNFDVLSDAFSTLKVSFTSPTSSPYLETNYTPFFTSFTHLLTSSNYVTRRFSLQLLSSVLLSRSNFNVMMRYISSLPSLKQIMNLLRDPHPNIQYESFHVFKVFVVNPRKTKEVEEVLRLNKVKLVKFLEGRWKDREGEGNFKGERELVRKTLEEL
ncbi:hypothetical protein TrST_g547 [Triparma strigata]|uniref:Mo25-like protein n=1 Tax=Triparma strigata TaxID=1606541 RepID=A0A9W7BP15_9STRA|nr:hypothetical protein TrST_g547 [Triparma strigata]